MLNVGLSPMFGFTSFAAYLLTHLMFLGKLSTMPLYTLDGISLFKQSTPAGIASSLTLAQYNLGLVLDHVPAKVFQQCGLDFDRWYPVPRRLVGQVQFIARHKRRREQYRRALDTVAERFGVACGPVVGERQPA